MCRVPLQYILNMRFPNRTLLEYFKEARRGPVQRPISRGSAFSSGSTYLEYRSCYPAVGLEFPMVLGTFVNHKISPRTSGG